MLENYAEQVYDQAAGSDPKKDPQTKLLVLATFIRRVSQFMLDMFNLHDELITSQHFLQIKVRQLKQKNAKLIETYAGIIAGTNQSRDRRSQKNTKVWQHPQREPSPASQGSSTLYMASSQEPSDALMNEHDDEASDDDFPYGHDFGKFEDLNACHMRRD